MQCGIFLFILTSSILCLSVCLSFFQVRDDIGTDVMRRSLAKQFVAGSEQTCVISIVLATRTLDFEIEEHSWRPIFHALQILVNYYRVIMPSVQTQRLSEERRTVEGNRGHTV